MTLGRAYISESLIRFGLYEEHSIALGDSAGLSWWVAIECDVSAGSGDWTSGPVGIRSDTTVQDRQ